MKRTISVHKQKPEGVTIVQIAVSGEEGNAHGLGSDGRMYWWDYLKVDWFLNAKPEIVEVDD